MSYEWWGDSEPRMFFFNEESASFTNLISITVVTCVTHLTILKQFVLTALRTRGLLQLIPGTSEGTETQWRVEHVYPDQVQSFFRPSCNHEMSSTCQIL